MDDESIDKLTYLLGTWIGDGSTSSKRISCSVNESDNQGQGNKPKKIAQELGLLVNKRKEAGNCYCVSLPRVQGSVDIYHKALKLGFQNIKTSPERYDDNKVRAFEYFKDIPSWFLSEKRSLRENFLAGWIDTDGHSNENLDQAVHRNINITVSEVHDKLPSALCKLVRSLGIRYSVF